MPEATPPKRPDNPELHDNPELPEKEHLDKFRELIKDIDTAMLVTETADGSLRSRPMVTQATEFDGELWFFTDQNSAKVLEIQADRHVCVSYADPRSHKFVSVSGIAELSQDRGKIKELWNPFAKAWFPQGPDDPRLALLRVRPTMAEYWDSSSGLAVTIAGMVKAATTGERLKEPGEHEKLSL
ncbi:pyridoxamine 5'-phosphate oxidase family protein [Candidatus Laterigemmans baculatus]|uniref:pyridoxamine 5'-phosphate oxidase family protein n=1 Tax=Candidatus Laterigemmans baculatus TaxID=2770505 RepID=UPI0013D8E3D6|nr:pyridoxamine 5'-phosphate oxidase family protein [Candidatus Laterigemmans baculatus]